MTSAVSAKFVSSIAAFEGQSCVRFGEYSGKRGGGIGFYIKETIPFNVRIELIKNDEPMEVLFTEVHGGSKNTPYLVAVTYQPNSNE